MLGKGRLSSAGKRCPRQSQSGQHGAEPWETRRPCGKAPEKSRIEASFKPVLVKDSLA